MPCNPPMVCVHGLSETSWSSGRSRILLTRASKRRSKGGLSEGPGAKAEANSFLRGKVRPRICNTSALQQSRPRVNRRCMARPFYPPGRARSPSSVWQASPNSALCRDLMAGSVCSMSFLQKHHGPSRHPGTSTLPPRPPGATARGAGGSGGRCRFLRPETSFYKLPVSHYRRSPITSCLSSVLIQRAE